MEPAGLTECSSALASWNWPTAETGGAQTRCRRGLGRALQARRSTGSREPEALPRAAAKPARERWLVLFLFLPVHQHHRAAASAATIGPVVIVAADGAQSFRRRSLILAKFSSPCRGAELGLALGKLADGRLRAAARPRMNSLNGSAPPADRANDQGHSAGFPPDLGGALCNWLDSTGTSSRGQGEAGRAYQENIDVNEAHTLAAPAPAKKEKRWLRRRGPRPTSRSHPLDCVRERARDLRVASAILCAPSTPKPRRAPRRRRSNKTAG